MRASSLSTDRNAGMLRLYAWAMIVTTGVAVAVALYVSRTDPRYSSTAEVVVAPAITRSGNYIEPSMPTEQRVATSTAVVRDAAEKLGVPTTEALDRISVSVPVDTEILVFTYTADTPTAALRGAKAISDSYLQTRNPKNGKDAVASLVGPPELPSTPLGTNYPVVLGAAVLGGLLTGYVLARAWDRVRGRIRTIADAEQCTELDALALTPRLPSTSIDNDRQLRACHSQLDALAARVLGEVEGENRSTLLVTGAASECGSTAVAALTALALARMGRVVVLVTADDQVVTRMSNNREPHGGTGGNAPDVWPDPLMAEQEGLHLVPVPQWDTAGIAAGRLTNLLPELRHRLPEALIVIDGPPAWYSAGIALRVDKILLVVALGRCSRKSTATAVQALDHCAEKMMGMVITPRRGPARQELVPVPGSVAREVSGFRPALPEVDSAPTPSPRPPSGAASKSPAPAAGTDQTGVKAARSNEAKSGRSRGANRRPKPQPNGEPTSSVLS